MCLISNGFKTNESDKCIYYKSNCNSHVIICLYVDDLLIFGTNLEIINATNMLLTNHFDMKGLEEANVMLGIRVTKTSNGIFLDQSHYIEKNFRKKYKFFYCKPL